MNVQELYDYITKTMTPEQALMKLLEGTVRTYENLKFNEGEEIHPTILITMAALDMDWGVAIPNRNPDEELQGFVVGTDEYLNELFGVADECGCGGGCSCEKPDEHNCSCDECCGDE